MEWNKAKNILIVTFLILDMVLGLMLFYSNSNTIRIKQSEVEDCKRILKLHNVLLKANIPEKVKPLANLSVSNVTANKNMMAELIKKNLYMSGNVDDKDSSLIHHYDNYYTKKGYHCMKKKNEIISDVKKILKRKKISTKLLKLESFKQNNTKAEVIFKEYYEGYNIANSYLKVSITGYGLVSIDYKWYSPNEFKADTNKLVSPLDSLITVLNTLKKEINKSDNIRKCSITAVNQVYYVEQTDKQNISQTEAIPAWEIVVEKIYKNNTKHNKRYYINSYENSLLK